MNTHLLFLVLVLPLGIFKATTAVETTTATTTCCQKKIISGDGDSRSGTYTFNTTMDVSTLPAECKDGCIYSKMGLDELFCFAPGNLTSKCVALTAISFPLGMTVVGSYPCTNEITASYKYNSAFVVLDEEIISCGGYQSGVIGSCQVWRNNTWQTFPPLNQGRSSFAMNTFQDTIVASGGFDVTGSYTSSMEIYNKTAGKWEELSVGLSFARIAHCAVDIGGKMLILGGVGDNENFFSTVEQYTINLDTSTAINEIKAPMLKERYGMGCTVFENNVYVSGYSEKTIDIYDVATDVWKQLPATPNDDGSSSRKLVNLNGALYIFGKKTQVYKEGNWSFVNDSTISEANFNMVVAPLPCEN